MPRRSSVGALKSHPAPGQAGMNVITQEEEAQIEMEEAVTELFEADPTTEEYQEILTITPSANSQNYSIIGKITANGGTQVQTIDVNIALRSNTRPNLNIAGTYTSTIFKNNIIHTRMCL